ncbi:MAG: hypothetical protein RL261_1911, partial [Pseudomonadota bacterium]
MSEHEFEPTPGLPERLPAGERMLWQGSPSWRALAVQAMHVRKVGVYFALLAAWDVYDKTQGGAHWLVALRGAAWLLVLGAAAIGVLSLLAWSQARSALYTITSQRVVLRFGVALPMAVNLPFRTVESAGIVRHSDGTADLPLLLAPGEQVSYFVTWPHVRPWRFFRVEPALRALPDG